MIMASELNFDWSGFSQGPHTKHSVGLAFEFTVHSRRPRLRPTENTPVGQTAHDAHVFYSRINDLLLRARYKACSTLSLDEWPTST